MMLKPQDVLVLLKIVLLDGRPWSYSTLAEDLFLSPSEAHAGLKRAEAARLVDLRERTVWKKSLAEFLVHGVRYAYPPERGGLTRGMPTGYAAPPLSAHFRNAPGEPPVWPTPDGTARGYAFSPLYESVPRAAARDAALYEVLALVDAIRDGRARETELAVAELRRRLGQGERA